MQKFFTIAALSFMIGAIAACGGDDDTTPTPGGGGDLTVDELTAKTLDIRCSKGVECHLYESEAECKATSTAGLDQYKASIAAGRIIYHPEKAQACLDALGEVFGCSIIDVFGPAVAEAEDACTGAYEPTVADGGTCYVNAECISQSCEIPFDCSMACCEGKCAAETQVKIGESCANGETCADGSYCKLDSMGMPTTCAAQAAEGQPCDSFDACKVPAFCALDFTTSMGTCVVPAAHGETCDLNAIFACDRLDDYCDAATTKCVSSKLVGEACGTDALCVYGADCKNGKCEKKPAAGGMCDPMDFAQCLGDLQCNAGGTCELPAEIICP
jgi:hypothetical protein